MKNARIEHEVAQIATRTGLRSARALDRLSARVAGRVRRAQVQDRVAATGSFAPGPSSDASEQQGFVEGFELVRRNVAGGWSPDESYDVSTRIRGTTSAFRDGASAARYFYNGLTLRPERAAYLATDPQMLARADREEARRLADRYAVRLPQ